MPILISMPTWSIVLYGIDILFQDSAQEIKPTQDVAQVIINVVRMKEIALMMKTVEMI